MSSTARTNSRPSWVSKTTFEALGVESGEESEEEVREEPTPQTSPPESSSESANPSKSAIKKAKAVARAEQRKAERAARREKATEVAARAASPVESVGPAESTSQEEDVPAADDEVSRPPIEKLAKVEDQPPPASHAVNGVAHVVTNDVPHPTQVVYSAPPPPVPPPSDQLPSNGHPATHEDASAGVHLSSTSEVSKASSHDLSGAPEKPAEDAEQVKKRQNVLTRTLWTFIMIGGFLTLLLMGHVYMIVLVMLCQTLVYREVTALFSLKKIDSGKAGELRGRDPWSKILNWYFFAVTNYFLYGESIIYYFKHVVFADANMTLFATNHRMVSFTLYTIGFMGFVMSLKRGYLKQQFGLFCWVHMTLLLIVVSSHFIVNNILEGMIWFWVPASLVICNDVFAYVWGVTCGRTPLIKLSPKKTVEGFVGAFFSTVIFGILWGTYFMRFDYMICPVHDLGVSAFSQTIHCTPNPVFVYRNWQMWAPLRVFLTTLLGRSVTTIPYAPYQCHLLFMSCFASLVAPFGGFFASGFKRAFNIKDFGHSIPGHGGMTDRMDCQFLMGVFTYVYYSSLIREHHVTVGSLLQMIVSGLTVSEQLELMGDLKKYLDGQGIALNL
ncbi:cytidylyltransferase family-domain-containing protein [Sparassis latifolia]